MLSQVPRHTFTFPLTNRVVHGNVSMLKTKLHKKYFKILLVQKCIEHSQMSLVMWLGFSVTLTLTDSSAPQCCLVTFAAASAAFWHPQHSSSRAETLVSGVHCGFHSGGSCPTQSPGDGRVGMALKACPSSMA